MKRCRDRRQKKEENEILILTKKKSKQETEGGERGNMYRTPEYKTDSELSR